MQSNDSTNPVAKLLLDAYILYSTMPDVMVTQAEISIAKSNLKELGLVLDKLKHYVLSPTETKKFDYFTLFHARSTAELNEVLKNQRWMNGFGLTILLIVITVVSVCLAGK